MILYGIGNCDTVKKARAWLDARGVAYDFHDYKTAGIDQARLGAWVAELGWERLLNRAGTTFRKLPEADKAGLDADKAVALMLAQPSMIRRPLLDLGDAAATWLRRGRLDRFDPAHCGYPAPTLRTGSTATERRGGSDAYLSALLLLFAAGRARRRPAAASGCCGPRR